MAGQDKETFIDKTFDRFLNPDYEVTDDNTNPKRDIVESEIEEEDKLNRLFGIVKTQLSEVKKNYEDVPIEEIRKETYDTGAMPMIYKTLEEELAQLRTGGNGLIEFSDLLDKELPIEKDIIETMIDLLIIEHYYGSPENDKDKDKKPKTPTDGDDEEGDEEGPYEPETTTGAPPIPPIEPKEPENDPYSDNQPEDGDPDKEKDKDFECILCADYLKNLGEEALTNLRSVINTGNSSNSGNNGNNNGENTNEREVGNGEEENETIIRAKEMAECAKMDLQILRIILSVCKIIKALSAIIDPIYAIVTQVIEIAALVCGCWSSPANIGEIVQRLIQMAISIATNIVTALLDKFWKMLGLQCLSEQAESLIQQIQEALRGVRQITSAISQTANAFSKVGGDIYKKSADVMKSFNNAKEEFLKNRENDLSDIKEMFTSMRASDFPSAILNGNTVGGNSITAIISNGLADSKSISDAVKWYKKGDALVKKSKEMITKEYWGEEINKFQAELGKVLCDAHIGFDYDENANNWGVGQFNFDNFGGNNLGKSGNDVWNTEIERLGDTGDAGKAGANAGQVLLNSFGISSYTTQGLMSNESTGKKVPKDE